MTYARQIANASQRMDDARTAGRTWVVAKPGCIPLYEAPSKEAAEAMLTRSLRKDGYRAAPATQRAAIRAQQSAEKGE
jgi:hypothetical protein